MKENVQCPKCQSLRIGYFEQLKDYDSDGSTARSLASSQEHVSFWKTLIYYAPVEAYVCADCGYFEEYVKEPSTIAWDKLPHFRWCRPEQTPEGPFR